MTARPDDEKIEIADLYSKLEVMLWKTYGADVKLTPDMLFEIKQLLTQAEERGMGKIFKLQSEIKSILEKVEDMSIIRDDETRDIYLMELRDKKEELEQLKQKSGEGE